LVFKFSKECFHFNQLITIETKRRGVPEAIFCALSEFVLACLCIKQSQMEKFHVPRVEGKKDSGKATGF